MNNRRRKLIGSLALLIFTSFYFLFAAALASVRLPSLALPWHLLYYFVASVLWMLPCGAIIRWMQRP
jgi:hypothetical protein